MIGRWCVVVLCLAFVAMPEARATQERPVFRSSGEIVRLDVLVADGGRPVTGLRPQDFTVLDNGVPQRVEFLSTDAMPLNVVLNFDVSGSVEGRRLQDLKAAGRAVLDDLHSGDQAALVSFSHLVAVPARLTSDFSAVRAALEASPPGGQTSLVDAALAGVAIGASQPGRSVMLTFSDGADTASILPPASVIDAARRAEVVVFGVSTGPLKASFLRDLADTTGGDTVEIRSTAELRSTLLKLLNEYRQRYLLAYSPAGVPSAGWHAISVTVSKKGATVKTRQGYQR